MRNSLLLSLAVVSLAGCAEAEAKNEVRKALIDPGSAEFNSVSTKNGIVCGLVNSKNRMGGYVGFRGFIVEHGRAKVESPPDPAFLAAFLAKCPQSSKDAYQTNYIYQNQ